MRDLVVAILAIALFPVSCAFSADDAVELYVAPDGNDAWSGTRAKPNAEKTDGPLASLIGARNALRKLRAGKAPDKPARIVVADAHAGQSALHRLQERGVRAGAIRESA